VFACRRRPESWSGNGNVVAVRLPPIDGAPRELLSFSAGEPKLGGAAAVRTLGSRGVPRAECFAAQQGTVRFQRRRWISRSARGYLAGGRCRGAWRCRLRKRIVSDDGASPRRLGIRAAAVRRNARMSPRYPYVLRVSSTAHAQAHRSVPCGDAFSVRPVARGDAQGRTASSIELVAVRSGRCGGCATRLIQDL
jgi:hypothetical protein